MPLLCSPQVQIYRFKHGWLGKSTRGVEYNKNEAVVIERTNPERGPIYFRGRYSDLFGCFGKLADTKFSAHHTPATSSSQDDYRDEVAGLNGKLHLSVRAEDIPLLIDDFFSNDPLRNPESDLLLNRRLREPVRERNHWYVLKLRCGPSAERGPNQLTKYLYDRSLKEKTLSGAEIWTIAQRAILVHLKS